MINPKWNRLYLRLLAFLIGIGGLYHAVGLFWPVNNFPTWRHAVFVLIDFYVAYGLIMRPRFFKAAFLIFTTQQFITHGFQLYSCWYFRHHIDWISLGVLFLFPLGCYVLLQKE